MQILLITAVIALVYVVIFQISKVSEYVNALKGEDASRKQLNKINGFLLLAFMIVGLVGVWYCNSLLAPKTLMFNGGAASYQGDKVDTMMWWTLAITGIVFFLTQILLFWFSFKYQENKSKASFYFPHSNKLEAIWTGVPAITLAILVVFGLINWNQFTSEAPDDALKVEVTGKQFGWIFRYPGKDKEFGKKYFRLIDGADNSLGLVWKDTAITKPSGDVMQFKADKYTQDDIVLEQTLYCVKDRPVKLIINSRDVIHDVGLPQFRMKMDAVPGMPTTLWFTPKYTTAEMKERTKNPNFQYEISCDQMCGNGHYSMKGVIEVLTQSEYDAWLAKQKPKYASVFGTETPAAAVDTTAKAAKTVVAMN